jgi:hypothetical protein
VIRPANERNESSTIAEALTFLGRELRKREHEILAQLAEEQPLDERTDSRPGLPGAELRPARWSL